MVNVTCVPGTKLVPSRVKSTFWLPAAIWLGTTRRICIGATRAVGAPDITVKVFDAVSRVWPPTVTITLREPSEAFGAIEICA